MTQRACFFCGNDFDPTKDSFVTFNERKGPSRDFCSLECAAAYINDDEVAHA